MDNPSTSRALMDHLPSQFLYRDESVEPDVYVPIYDEQPVEQYASYTSSQPHAREISAGYLSQYEYNGQMYVQDVARKFATRPDAMLRSRNAHPRLSTAVSMKGRLSKTLCDVETLSCGVSYCGRSFNSLQVLAFHMSYAHSDLSSTGSLSATCLVCGLQLDSAKGKTVHLVSKHRAISTEHNSQCVRQQEPVISPYAPAAFRLQYGTAERDTDDEYISNDDLNVPFLDLSQEHDNYQ